MRRALVGLVIAAAITVVPAANASAHPLGNFTINQYTAIHFWSNAVTVEMITDEAEIPTVQARGEIDTDHDGAVSKIEADVWRRAACATAASEVRLRLDGASLAVVADGPASLTFPPGQAGLSTLRLECTLRSEARLNVGDHSIAFTNSAFAGRLGWHEIVVPGENVTLDASDVPTASTTGRLTSYPSGQLHSPLAQRDATVRFRTTSATPTAPLASSVADRSSSALAATRLLPRGVDRAGRAFTNLVARHDLTVGFALLAVGIAAVLGAFHALAPGHGKTVMAAYIVGQRGTFRQAAFIGLAVTATHTAGIVVLGITLTTTTVLTPERLYPWLGLTSGLLLAGIGTTLARRALVDRRRHPDTVAVAATHDLDPVTTSEPVLATVGAGHAHHDHDSHHDHAHHDHDSHHDHDGHDDHNRHHDHDRHLDHDDHHRHHDVGGAGVHSHGGWSHVHAPIDLRLGWRSLLGIGFAGGLVPSPSALLVLLGAIALGRTWFGLLLVTAYGLGMATMLTTAGLVLLRARVWFERRAIRRTHTSTRLVAFARLAPIVTSATIVVVGLTLAVRAALQL